MKKKIICLCMLFNIITFSNNNTFSESVSLLFSLYITSPLFLASSIVDSFIENDVSKESGSKMFNDVFLTDINQKKLFAKEIFKEAYLKEYGLNGDEILTLDKTDVGILVSKIDEPFLFIPFYASYENLGYHQKYN